MEYVCESLQPRDLVTDIVADQEATLERFPDNG
jgi:hypothetical protein